MEERLAGKTVASYSQEWSPFVTSQSVTAGGILNAVEYLISISYKQEDADFTACVLCTPKPGADRQLEMFAERFTVNYLSSGERIEVQDLCHSIGPVESCWSMTTQPTSVF